MPDFFKTKAIRVEQPLGIFFTAAIPAEKLLEVCFSERLTAVKNVNGYSLEGAQRKLAAPRLLSLIHISEPTRPY